MEDFLWRIGGALDAVMLDQAQAQALSDQLWRKHRRLGEPWRDEPPQIIVDVRARYPAFASAARHQIVFQPNEARLPTLCHELSHLLVRESGHGVEWLGIVMQLWESELRIPRDCVRLAAEQMMKSQRAA